MALSKLITKIKTDYPAYKEDFFYSCYTFLRFKGIRFRRYLHQFRKRAYLRQISGNKSLKKNLLSKKNQSTFFFDPKKVAETIQPYKNEIIAEANKICHHEFNLLGSGPTNLSPEINWHQDFKDGHIFPNIHNTLVTYTPGAGHDIKVPWELSRFQHLTALGQAYALTKDSKYVTEFINQITDWTEKNPLYFGPNWKCTMDIAIRACNWIITWQFFQSSPEITDKFRSRFYNSLLQHGKYIINNLEWSALTSNHYLANITGLIYLGLMFPNHRPAQKWLRRGIKSLEKEIQKQVYADGVDFEASIAYHRLVLESFAYPTILCQLNNIKLSTKFWQRLEAMFDFTLYYTKQNGLAPMIGDCDDGRIHVMSAWSNWEKRDHRYLLTVAAHLFDDEKYYPYKTPNLESVLLIQNLQVENVGKSLPTPDPSSIHLNSRSYNYGGIYIFRNHQFYCLVTASPNGQNGNGGHAHNDTLSFELNKNGLDFIIDPGSYIYTPDPATRNHFRSTCMHNTITIDEQEINEITSPNLFQLTENAIPELEKWSIGSEKDELIASHNGYTRLKNPIIHRRHFIFDKHSSIITINDLLISKNSAIHKLEWNFHLTPEIKINQTENQITLINNATTITLVHPENLKFTIEETETSPSYGVKIPTKSLRANLETQIDKQQEFRFTIS